MKARVRRGSLPNWLSLPLFITFAAVGCGDDATPRTGPGESQGTDERPGTAGPMPGEGMMTPEDDDAEDDDSSDEEEPAQARDASRPRAVDGGKPSYDAGRDAGGASAAADAGRQSSTDGGVARNDGGMSGTGPVDTKSVCAGGKVGMDSDSATTRNLANARNLAIVVYNVPPPNRIVSFKTTMVVPKTPAQRATLFIWPGLQPRGGADPARIGNGVLQPVLTWGPSCSRTASNSRYTDWMIAGMYVNISTSAAGPSGCASGPSLEAEVGARLFIDMFVEGTSWTQSVTHLGNMKKVDFKWDLKGQDQNWAIWDIETPTAARPAEDSIFEDSVITAAQPLTSCQPTIAAEVDYFSAPVLSPDGLRCCIDKLILKQQRN